MNKPGNSISNIVSDTLTFMGDAGLPMAKSLKTLVSLGESQLLLCHIIGVAGSPSIVNIRSY